MSVFPSPAIGLTGGPPCLPCAAVLSCSMGDRTGSIVVAGGVCWAASLLTVTACASGTAAPSGACMGDDGLDLALRGARSLGEPVAWPLLRMGDAAGELAARRSSLMPLRRRRLRMLGRDRALCPKPTSALDFRCAPGTRIPPSRRPWLAGTPTASPFSSSESLTSSCTVDSGDTVPRDGDRSELPSIGEVALCFDAELLAL